MKSINKVLLTGIIAFLGMGLLTPSSNTNTKSEETTFSGAQMSLFGVTDEPKYTYQKEYQFDIMNATSKLTATGGSGVTVAVIDTGVNIYHEDFLTADAIGKTITSSNVTQYSILNPKSCYIHDESGGYSKSSVKTEVGILKCLDEDISATEDYYSHGTCTASVIGAAVNSVGGLGLASGVDLMVIRCDLYDTSIDVAIKYATDNGADIISMSFGGYAETFYDGYGELQEGSSAIATDLIDAIDYAYNKGVTLFAAAGNEKQGGHLSYPAANEHVIGVGALAEKSNSTKADYSNWNVTSRGGTIAENNNVDVVAPGTVYTATVKDARYTSAYGTTSGTSFACPLTAAAAALYKSQNPTATPDEIEQAIYKSCDDLGSTGFDKYYGNGRVDVTNLLEYDVNVDGVTLDKSSLSMVVEDGLTLTATVSPSTATNKNVTWTSSDTSVATVDSKGKVTATGVGNATITVTTKDGGYKATCQVSVSKNTNPVTSVKLNSSSIDINKRGTGQLTATVSPSNATNKNVIWSSSDTSIVTVDSNGNLTGVNQGTATITATTVNKGLISTCSVTVKGYQVPVTGVSLNQSSITLKKSASQQLVATLTPTNPTDTDVTWSSSDTSVASVSNNGLVTANGYGEATITVKTDDGGYTATCTVNVAPSITLSKTSITLNVGDSATITATIDPSETIKWVSNSEVEIVSGISSSAGSRLILTGVQEGTVRIYAYPESDSSYRGCYCEVTVTKASSAFEMNVGVIIGISVAVGLVIVVLLGLLVRNKF